MPTFLAYIHSKQYCKKSTPWLAICAKRKALLQAWKESEHTPFKRFLVEEIWLFLKKVREILIEDLNPAGKIFPLPANQQTSPTTSGLHTW